MQKLHICITVVIELMTLQEIPNMGKGIQLSLLLNKKIETLELIKHEDTTQQFMVYLCLAVPSLVFS